MITGLETAALIAFASQAAAGVAALAKKIRDTYHFAEDRLARSVAERSRAATIYSRVYVDSSLADDEVMVPLISTLNQLYAAYIVTSLGLSSYISEGRTVGDITREVASEGLIPSAELLRNNLKNCSVALEAAGGQQDDPNDDERSSKFRSKPGNTMKTEVINLTPSEQHLVAGRVIELGVTSKSGATVPIRVTMQLVPQIITKDVAIQFMDMAAPINKLQRRMALKTKQIKFWRDFVFEIDRMRKLRNAMSQDRTGILKEAIAKSSSALTKYWLNLSGLENNYNAASSILIIDRQTYMDAVNDGMTDVIKQGISGFFKKSMVLFFVVLDRDINVVNIYTHGIPGVGEYSFNQIEKVGASGKGMNLKDVMTVLGRGAAPRF